MSGERRSRGGKRARRGRDAERKRDLRKVYAQAAALIAEALGQWQGKEYDDDHQTWGLAPSGEALIDKAFLLLRETQDELAQRCARRIDDMYGEMDEGRYFSDFAQALVGEALSDLEKAAAGVEVPRPAPVLWKQPGEPEQRFSVEEFMHGADGSDPAWCWMTLCELVEHGMGIDTGEQEYLLNPAISAEQLKAQMVDYYDAHLEMVDDSGDELGDPRSLTPGAHVEA